MAMLDEKINYKENYETEYDYRVGRVSIIIPTYNYAGFILYAIESALGQHGVDIEIIVVDDGSTDDTGDKLKPYLNRIKYIYQENAGLCAARNTGIRNSSGEFLLFLDSDDILGPGIIASQLKFFKNNSDADVVVCQNRFFSYLTMEKKPKITGEWRLFKNNLAVHLCHFNIAPPHAFLFRRKVILQTGWFDSQEQTCGDYDFWLRAAMRGFVPYYNNEGLVYYRRHPQSMSANLKYQYSHDAIMHKRLSILLDHYPLYPKGNRLEGLMAFISGILITVARLHDHKIDGANELLDLSIKKLKEAYQHSGLNQTRLNLLIYLFYFRIINSLTHPIFRYSNAKNEILKILNDIMTRTCTSSKRLNLFAHILISAQFKSHPYFVECRELRRLLIHYLKGHILSYLK
jgi:glycosyltransferase involved in cell wall biosynthesis